MLGNTATFTVAASSGTTLSYQWYKVGLLGLDSLLSGQTSTNLVLSNVGLLDLGQFYVKVSNAGGTVQSRSASLSLALGNSVPVASNDSYSTLEDTLLSIPAPGVLANDTDANGETMVTVLMTNVSQGTLSLTANGAFSYQPPTNFAGTVSFTYRASDGYLVLAEQHNSSGDATEIRSGEPGAQSFRHGTAGGASYMINKVVIYVSRKTGSSGNLNFKIGTGINTGTIAGSAVAIPSASITNTSEGSSFQTFEILYNTPVGPFVAGTTYYLNLDTSSSARFYLDHSPNAYANGTYYDQGSDQNEDLRFQLYKTVPSNPATVTINVLPVEDPPTAANDTRSTQEDNSVMLKLLANDSDPEGAPISLTGAWTANGTVAISGTNVIYLPPTNFNGTVTLNYSITDGGFSSTGRVTVTVTPVNDAPVAAADSYTTPEDSVLSVPVAGLLSTGINGASILANDSDVDGDPLTALLVTDVSHGSLVLNSDGSFTYTPAQDFYGIDSFTYVACDGPDDSPVTTVTINVTPIPDPVQLTYQQMSTHGFQFQIEGSDAATYVILATTNLRDWAPIFTNYSASGSMTFTDTSATNRIRFYRVETR